MKTPATLFLALLSLLYACVEKKSVSIQDVRSRGFKLYADTSILSRAKGDVYVEHILARGEGLNARHDTLELYDIHFIGLYKGGLKNYNLPFNDTVFYDKLEYKWFGDSLISMRLKNTLTNKQTGNMNLRPGLDYVYVDYGHYEW
jgi:hypothetical protein